MSGGYKRLAP